MGGYIGAKTGTLVASASDIRGDISATDTSPEITLKNTTETDADGSRSSKITFKGEQSGGEESTLAQIQASHDATADDEKGDLIFKTNDGNDGASPTERLRIDSNGAILTATLGTDNGHLGEGAGDSITSGGTNNVTIGKNAGTAITTGDDNIAIGTSAGDALTTSEHNVAVGKDALSTETLGSYNTAIGTLSLSTQNNSDIDVYNTAVGALAGRYITTGNQNSMFGAQAADALTTGQYNTALGYKALSLDTKGNRATAVGYEALANQNYTSSSDNINTAVGFHAGKEITTGTENTVMGGEAGDALTVGNGNVAIGVQALSGDINGSRSVAVGTTALKVTEASGPPSNNVYNVGVGYGAGLAVTTGYYHTIMGGLAADNMETGAGNTIIGYQAGDDITTDCDYNVCIGYNSGDGLVSDGDYNVFVGGSTTTNASASDNQIVMGYGVDSVGGGYITFGNNSGGRVYNHPYSNATWTRTSDERIKKDIQTNTDLGLNFINDLRTVTYKWKAPSEHPEEFVS